MESSLCETIYSQKYMNMITWKQTWKIKTEMSDYENDNEMIKTFFMCSFILL